MKKFLFNGTKEAVMKKITERIKNTVCKARQLLVRLLHPPAAQPALQPVPIRSRRLNWRK
jgi:hypothetical protein